MTPDDTGAAECSRIFIVDDHPLTRYGLARLIELEPDMELCGEAESADQALRRIKDAQPDLLVTDLTMPGKSGLEFIKDVKALHAGLRVLVVSMHDETLYAERVLRAGASGYLMKSAGGSMVIKAIRHVLGGQVYVSDGMSSRILDAFAGKRSRDGDSTLGTLTDREFEVFQLVGRGLTTREIAADLRISSKTVETHRLKIRDKLKLKTAPELLRFAVNWAASQSADAHRP